MNGSPTVRQCRFGPLDVVYDERTLTPRAWTLAQSRWAADLAAHAGPGPLLELCAGVGHIGLAAAVLAGRDLIQIEVDPVAAGRAAENAVHAGWGGRVDVRVAPISQGVRPDERFPIVIADPPYLQSRDVDRYPGDPRLAIDGGEDGLAVVRTCLAVGSRHLMAGGALLLQVAGPRQADAVHMLVAGYPAALRPVETRVIDGERAIMLLCPPG